MAEFGFLGVLVVTLVATPRLKGELKKVGQTAKDKKTKEEEKIVKEIRDKYWVK